jgi:hypothetical protein
MALFTFPSRYYFKLPIVITPIRYYVTGPIILFRSYLLEDYDYLSFHPIGMVLRALRSTFNFHR